MKKLWLFSKDSEINSILSNNVNTEAAVCTLVVLLEHRHPRENPPTEKDNCAYSYAPSPGVSPGKGSS